MSRQFRGYASRGGSLRSTQMSLAQRQAYIQRRQRQMGVKVTSFAPTSRVSALAPETKYFDCGINTGVTWTGTDWSGSEVPCDNYVNSSGTAAAYTDSALIPSAIGSGYGQVNGNRYKLKKLRVRGQVNAGLLSDQADASQPVFYRIMLVMDTQPNGSQAQGEDIFQDIGATGENLYSFQRTAASSGRFRILKDKKGVLQPTNSQTDGTNTASIGFQAHQFSWTYQPRTPIQVNLKSGNSTPTVAGLESCNIFMLCGAWLGQSGTAQQLFVVAASRAYYVD